MPFFFAGFVAFLSAKWYVRTYGHMGFDSILYTLLADLTGVGSDLIVVFALESLVPAVLRATDTFYGLVVLSL